MNLLEETPDVVSEEARLWKRDKPPESVPGSEAPERPSNVPSWFNWGHEFRIEDGPCAEGAGADERPERPDARILAFKNGTICFSISRWDGCWLLQYHNNIIPGGSILQGKIWLEGEELRLAFNLTEAHSGSRHAASSSRNKGLFGDPAIEREGKFVRTGDFLNLLGRGTGRPMDPTMSVHLTDAIKDALRKHLGL
jgi:hypothetical protein